MKLLHIDSSVLNDHSASRKLTAEIVEQIRNTHAQVTVSYRDLAVTAPAHLSAEILGARFAPQEQWTEVQKQEHAITESLLSELFEADTIIIGAPMYNFGIPTQLKAWIDRIAQAGRTFRYSANGPEGLVTGKKVIIASSRGGVFSTSEQMRAMDFQEDYLKAVLGFLGMHDVTIIRAEGLSMGDANRNAAFDTARAAINDLFAVAA